MNHVYSKGHKLKLNMTEENRGQVWLDGKELHGVIGVKLEASAHDVSRASLEFFPGAVEVDGEFEVARNHATPPGDINPWHQLCRCLSFDCLLRDRWEAAVSRAWFALRTAGG